jgi:iron complex outermembrane receptor protein
MTLLSHRLARLILCAVLALPVLAVVVPAQLDAQTAPSVTGSVVDSMGAVVAHAKIAVHSPDNKVTRSAIADDAGHFKLSNVPAGDYILDADAPGFATTHEGSVIVASDKPTELTVSLRIGNLELMVEVQADASNSIAAQQAPMDARLDARSARTEISQHFIENYTTPTADNTEMIFFAPGTFSVNSNGSGLGDSKNFFRGFSDGNYDITFDGIPYEDTNSPTHHSWAFFPSPFIGSVDFDRSPGSASTVGPTPFGGSINMLSKTLRQNPDIIGSVSYGTWNTILTDVQVNSGALGANKKTHFLADFNHLTSDGFQSGNAQMRSAGDIKVEYRFNDEKILTGYSGVGLLDTNTPNTKGPTRTSRTTPRPPKRASSRPPTACPRARRSALSTSSIATANTVTSPQRARCRSSASSAQASGTNGLQPRVTRFTRIPLLTRTTCCQSSTSSSLPTATSHSPNTSGTPT